MSLASSLIVTKANAQEFARPEILSYLENLLWTADGLNAARPLYVLFEPTCPYSKAMYHDSRQSIWNTQLKWIPMANSTEHSQMLTYRIAKSRDLNTLHACFSGTLSVTESDLSGYHFDEVFLNKHRNPLENNTLPLVRSATARPVASPTSIFKGPQEWANLIRGSLNRDQLEDTIRQIKS